jgi:polar amino acid transport system ATP-binding protein
MLEPEALIEYRAVRKTFGEVEVLNDFSLSVGRGERVCLIGPSGSGKSTVLRLLMTLEQPTAGEILVGGEALWPDMGGNARCKLSVAQRQVQDRLRRRMGMVFQHFNLFPHLTVRDNVALAPTVIAGESRQQAAIQADLLLEQVGLGDKSNSYPAELSGGQKQRVAIARALAMKPDVMLFDEATSALDPELVGEVVAVIRQLAEKTDMTMLFVTHQLHFVERIADRVLVLDGGSIVEDGPPASVLRSPQHERTQRFLAALEEL